MEWIEAVQQTGALVSQDGRGRALDNVMVERLWRTVKYEHIYLKDYTDLPELRRGLAGWFEYYNDRRWHQSLGNRTPEQVYRNSRLGRRGTNQRSGTPRSLRLAS